jgi:thioredoxin reductase
LVFQNHTYDYIVVGGGPSGIISAEKFAQAGKKVLLLIVPGGHGWSDTSLQEQNFLSGLGELLGADDTGRTMRPSHGTTH